MRSERIRWALPVQMGLGVLAGVVLGKCWPHAASELAWVTVVFASAIKMIVMPLVFFSVTVGVFRAGSERHAMRRAAFVAVTCCIVMTLCAAALGVLLNIAWRPGLAVAAPHGIGSALHVAGQLNVARFVADLVPSNIVAAMAAGNPLPVVVFAVVFGAALAATRESARPLIDVFDAALAALFKMTGWVIAFSPLAIACALAGMLAANGLSAMTPLVRLLALAYAGMAALALGLTCVIRLCGYSPVNVLRHVGGPLILAFATRSSEITLPLHWQRLRQMGVSEAIVSTILPLAYIFNRQGAVFYAALAVSFLVDVYHAPWSAALMATIVVLCVLAIDGAANVPSGAVVAMAVVLSAIGVPVEALTLLLGLDALFDMGRTALNVYASSVAVLIAERVSGRAAPAAGVARGVRNDLAL